MESKVRILSEQELIPPLLELLEEAGSVPLLISGNSMNPFLVHYRDTVFLSKIRRPLKRGDMILYRRDSGKYVLHRIYRTESGTYTLVGDAQTELERGIRPDQALALVTAVRRKGKYLESGSFWWVFFEKIWIRIVPHRHRILKGYSLATRLFR